MAHDKFMKEALLEAREAAAIGEAPVGCVIVYDGKIIARGHNLREGLQDPSAHAEMIALREASRKLGQWRLSGATIYVTLEPCAMCAGALVLARIDRLVFGCDDAKAGACGSVFDIVREPRLNHSMEVIRGPLESECQAELTSFFSQRRKTKPVGRSEELGL
ncbi:MAG TPA: tRNA adenosine(34) deaminase TadA [Nitrospiria bacterium]|nr:tRNA adenosine(34) deaminase TadA [Nitrospiria bacterium]